MKHALITGISGQDGSYLAEYLLSLGYRVYGLTRRDRGSMRWVLSEGSTINLLSGDVRDTASLEVAFHKAWPDEVYNLAAQVFVPASWACPAETFDINVGGLARLLDITVREKPDTRIYQASSSEMFGNVNGACNEHTLMCPTSPYGVSKLAAHRLVAVYRDRGIYAVSGILFNHESPRRGPEMVTRKITLAAAEWSRKRFRKLHLGNLEARRDWGFAGDYVRAMHAMLQQSTPKDYVIGTGQSHSVREFVSLVLLQLGLSDERTAAATVDQFVEVDPRLFRPGEIYDLCGNSELARRELGWKPEVEFTALVRMMVDADVQGYGSGDDITSSLADRTDGRSQFDSCLPQAITR